MGKGLSELNELNELEMCAAIIAKRGYLICCTSGPRKLGEIEHAIDGRTMKPVGQPLRIVRETTRDDYNAQAVAMGESPFGWHCPNPHYYIVESD
jgi:hypothetical protein